MKQHHSIFPPAASLACALILMLAACTSDALDELPPAGTDPDARPLTITVSDGTFFQCIGIIDSSIGCNILINLLIDTNFTGCFSKTAISENTVFFVMRERSRVFGTVITSCYGNVMILRPSRTESFSLPIYRFYSNIVVQSTIFVILPCFGIDFVAVITGDKLGI